MDRFAINTVTDHGDLLVKRAPLSWGEFSFLISGGPLDFKIAE